jgi:hypothetical protein
MVLIAVYNVFVVIGDALAVGIAELVESYVSKGASLAAFSRCFSWCSGLAGSSRCG